MPLSTVLSLSLSVSRSGFARMIGNRRFPSFLSCKTIYINVAYVDVVCFLKHILQIQDFLEKSVYLSL